MDPYKYTPASAYNTDFWTTNQGGPVFDNDHSLTAGPRGPVLLEDYHLIEKLAQFDRERIPERVVHARGAVAKGYFEVTHDVTDLTCADFLRAVGTRTPLLTRFSTVIHPRGSPETLRDPRGFAVKFYTREGNYDLVGNNMPVFFIRDAMKFPDLVHAFKPNPANNLQEDWRIIDFLSHHPESLHMLTFLDSDVGIPRSYRTMPGFGVHTFVWINAAGKETYVKYHWVPAAGTHSLLEDEAMRVGGANHSHATADLYNHIAEGGSAEWELCIQTMDPATENDYDFDPLDPSKTWPEDKFPLRPVGRMVLNENPTNFFAENEQVAFCPGVVVPGITYSDDKLLQGRIFSYSDTQRHRLGPNYLLLPVNAPKCRYHNNHHEGVGNTTVRTEEVNYYPSNYTHDRPANRWPMRRARLGEARTKETIPKEDNFSQAGARIRSLPADERKRLAMRTAGRLSDGRLTEEVRERFLGFWKQADAAFEAEVRSMIKVM